MFFENSIQSFTIVTSFKEFDISKAYDGTEHDFMFGKMTLNENAC